MVGGVSYIQMSVSAPTPTPTPALIDYPRIAVIGPSTDENNLYGAASPNRAGPAGSGNLMWALMQDRRAAVLEFNSAASPYFGGDIKAVGGAVFADYPAQISAAITRKDLYPGNWIAAYNAGRNPLQDGQLLADYQSGIARDIAALRAGGFTYILLANLGYKPAAYGGGWVAGGAYRVQTDLINAWIVSTYGAASDIYIIDQQTALMDPATAGTTKEPYANAYRSDFTHLTTEGGERAAVPYLAALQTICTARSYPTTALTLSDMGGSGGTISGTGLTGAVVNGWGSVLTAGPTVVAETVVDGAKRFQRFTISNTQGIAAAGVNLVFSKTVKVPVAAAARVGLRAKYRATASSVKHLVFASFGNATGQGDTVGNGARAGLFAGVADPTATAAVGGAGTGFSGVPGFLKTTAKNLWLETATYVIGASGGSTVSIDFTIIIGPGDPGDTLVIEIADVQDFLYPVQT